MTNPQILDPNSTVRVLLAPTEFFIDLLCQKDEHVKSFRWFWYCRGVDVRKNGRRYDLRGELIQDAQFVEAEAA